MIQFLVHYWLFTAATLAGVWVIAVHLLRRNEVGPVGRELARRETKRVSDYRAAVALESAQLPDEPDEPQKPLCSR